MFLHWLVCTVVVRRVDIVIIFRFNDRLLARRVVVLNEWVIDKECGVEGFHSVSVDLHLFFLAGGADEVHVFCAQSADRLDDLLVAVGVGGLTVASKLNTLFVGG